MPIFVDAVETETKFSIASKLQITANASNECVNKDDYSDIALNCDNLDKIEIKQEIVDDAQSVADEEQHVLMSSCDSKTGDKHCAGTKPTYLCHRCKQVFNSRDTFETHYKYAYYLFARQEPYLYCTMSNFSIFRFFAGKHIMKYQFIPVKYVRNK